MPEGIVRVQALDGRWETLGVERFPGLGAQQIAAQCDTGGPSSASFTIQRTGPTIGPDLLAWTPCEIEVDGDTVWDGRIKETPGGDGISVQMVGWQSHLDDDARERFYVHQDLSAWQDARANPSADLTTWAADPQVSTGQGSIALVFPANTAVAATKGVGITLDLGPDNRSSEIYIDYVTVPGGSNPPVLYLRGSNAADGVSGPGYAQGVSDVAGSANPLPATGTTPITVGGPVVGYRYLTIFLWSNNGWTPTADTGISISRILVCANAAYSTDGGSGWQGSPATSDLRASDVILDKVGLLCPLITAAPESPDYQAEVLAADPVSYWTLDQGDATVPYGSQWFADRGSAANPVVYVAPSAVVVPSLRQADGNRTALQFNGTSTYLQANSSAAYGPNGVGAGGVGNQFGLTLEAVIQVNAYPNGFSDVVRRDPVFTMQLDGGGHLRMYLGTAGGGFNIGVTSNNPLPLGVPLHIAVVYAINGLFFLYVNGAGIPYTGNGGAIGPLLTVSGAVAIGSISAGTGEYFNGVIQDVAVYGYGLSPAQITQHYRAALSRQIGRVRRTQFQIPHYCPSGSQTPNTDIAAVNALHNWKVEVPVGRQLVFEPQDDYASLRVAEHVDFQDTGANDGTAVYNKVIVEGQDVTGAAIRVTMHAQDLAYNGARSTIGAPQLADPGFESGVSGGTRTSTSTKANMQVVASNVAHTGAGSTLAYSTGNIGGSGAAASYQSGVYWTVGQFAAGAPYTLTVWVRVPSTWGTNQVLELTVCAANYANAPAPLITGATPNNDGVDVQLGVGAFTYDTWFPIQATWTPAQAETGYLVLRTSQIGSSASGAGMYVDDVAFTVPAQLPVVAKPTVVDRRSFYRAKVLTAQSAIDEATATDLATAFLLDSWRIPFKGSFVAQSAGDVLTVPSDEPVAPARLLRAHNRIVRVPAVDPDTGEIGRDGKIVQVSYDNATGQATVTVDDDRNSLQALMARMAVLQQPVTGGS